jgi:radical SAM protein with 4Fe4S-binding SPASM domain
VSTPRLLAVVDPRDLRHEPSTSRALRGGASGLLPEYLTILQDDLAQLLGAAVRVATPEPSPMVEVRSLVNDRSVYFHPPTGTILVYDTSQGEQALSRAHDILQRHPPRMSHPAAGTRVGSIEYYATGACNLRCGYCYLGPLADEPGSSDLNPAGFLTRIEQLIAEGRIAPRLRIAVMGGEPLLAFDGIRRVIQRTEELTAQHDIDVSFGMTTNGYLLDEGVSEFLKAHRVALKISYDGDHTARNRPAKAASDRPQPPTLGRLRELTEGLRVTVNATLLPPQFASQGDVFAGLADAGFSRVQISVANGFRWSAADLRRFFGGLCALTWEAERRSSMEVQQAQVLDTLRDYTLRRSHCGAGVSHLAIDAAGNIESCSTSFNHDGHGRNSAYGFYDVDEDPACGACAVRYGCGGGCRAFRQDGQPDITDCAPIYLRFLMAMGLAGDLPGFRSSPHTM